MKRSAEDGQPSRAKSQKPDSVDMAQHDIDIFLPGDSSMDGKRCLLVAALAKAKGKDVPWRVRLALTLGTHGSAEVVDATKVEVRAVRKGDEAALIMFGKSGLSDKSRRSFAPYNWDSPNLRDEFTAAIAKSIRKEDLHFVAVAKDEQSDMSIVAHAFLWSAQDEVPELGIAVADAWQRRGLGCALLLLLENVARMTGRKAIELTTMQTNEPAYRAYIRAGYEYLGIIRNPVGVDVPAAFRGEVIATQFCDERSLIRILDESARENILKAMASKREMAAKLFGEPTM